MIIYLATDHAGFELKNQLKEYLESRDHTVIDKGAYEFNPTDDYPDFIAPVAKIISENPFDARAIILGGSGEGEAMVANRFLNVRATVYYGGSLEIIELSRKHNDANVLSLGARFISYPEATAAIDRWLLTKYEGGRHDVRIHKIDIV